MVQWLGLGLPMQGVWVQSLAGEQDPTCSVAKKKKKKKKNPTQNIKQKKYCNKFRKNCKTIVHIKKKKKKSALVEGVSSAREHTCTPPPSTSPGGRGARLLALPVAVLSVPVRLPDVYLALLAQPHHATVPHFSMTLYS